MSVRPPLSETLTERLRKVKLLLLDVDGILTDCRVYQSPDGEWRRFFSIRDGYGIVELHKAGYKTGIITASKARDIKDRAQVLGINYFFDGSQEKSDQLDKLLRESGFKETEAAFMGDDVFDVPVLRRVGFAATVSDAMEEAIQASQYVARRPAGNGAVREVCDLILRYGAFSNSNVASSGGSLS